MKIDRQLQVLIIDDSVDDADVIARQLQKWFGDVHVERVHTASTLRAALQLGRWDVILSDNQMPAFSGMGALEIVKANDPDIPFILVSGTMGEEAAVAALKAGVDDYVLKENLQRLEGAFKSQLLEAERRRTRRQSIDALQESEQRFRQLADNIDLFFYLTDPENSRIFYASPAYENIWGRSLDTLYANPRSWLPSVHEDDRSEMVERVDLASQGPIERRYRIIRADGAVRWIRSRRFPIRNQSGEAYRIAGIVEDITERKEIEEKLIRLNRVHAVLSGINSLIVRVGDREKLCHEACRIAVEAGQLRMAWLGLYDSEAMRVTPVASHGIEDGFLSLMSLYMPDPIPEGSGLVRRVVREKRPVVLNDIEHDNVFRLRAEAMARGYRSGAVLPLIVGGELAGVLGLFAAESAFFDDEQMRLLIELAGDISFALDHIAKAERLDYLAYYDSLTGLANRTLFLEHVAQACDSEKVAGRKLAVVAMDIERFRTINDTLGRQAGDDLLKQIAVRLTGHSRETSRFARVGADHFAIMVPDVRGEEELARLFERRLGEVFGSPYHIHHTDLRIGAKLGAAIFPGDGEDAETLLKNAEAALKKAKGTGERYLFYQQQMTERVGEQLRLENRLRRALENEEFRLHYQPKIDLKSRAVVGMEALIRWQMSEGELMPPAKFIPLMEETGLILDVGAWALQKAASDHYDLTSRGIAVPRIAVNVSAVQLRKRDFVETVMAAIGQGALSAGIDLEITESVIMEDTAGSIQKLSALRELGLEIAIDDFGTGYSSLAYLARLPVNSLKIDRSFIITMVNDPNTRTLVSTIISLAHSLKLKVVAEGVDSEDQATLLRALRCDEMQGYLYSKPLPLEEVMRLLVREGSGSAGSRQNME